MRITVSSNKAKFLVMLIGIAIIIGYYGIKLFDANKGLSQNELTEYISRYCLQGKGPMPKSELETNVDDLHLVVFSYNEDSDTVVGLALFKRLTNGKYQFMHFESSTLTPDLTVITTDTGTKALKNYAVFYGTIADNQPNKYMVKANGKEFTDEFQRNKVFLKDYQITTSSGVGLQARNS